jgi:hypothetical protein
MPGGAASVLLAAAVAAAGTALPPLVRNGAVAAPWHVVTLPQQKPPVTRYTAETVDGREAVRLQADASYGNLVLDRPGEPAPRRLAWSWRLQQPNPGVDPPAKVCLSFRMPMEQVPFFERTLLSLARSSMGQDLPAATLCWVWGGAEPRGTLLDNPYSRRVRVIVLRNRDDALGTWFEESRDVAADFQRAFGDESATVPPLDAVIVAADADNTGGTSRAWVASLRAEP